MYLYLYTVILYRMLVEVLTPISMYDLLMCRLVHLLFPKLFCLNRGFPCKVQNKINWVGEIHYLKRAGGVCTSLNVCISLICIFKLKHNLMKANENYVVFG